MTKEFIFEEGRGFGQCHASTLVELPGGDVLAAWFGGTREGVGDVGIWTSRRTGQRWTEPVSVAGEETLPHWNPVLFLAPDGRLHMYYKVGKRIPEWRSRVIRSHDGGCSWSPPEELVPGDRGGRGPVRNKPIVLSNGDWLAPASLEGELWDAFVDISTDQGNTWTASAMVPVDRTTFKGKGIIQPALWESKPGRVHMLLRSTCGRICRSDSDDYGRSWSLVYETGLPNNNSGIDVVKLREGTLALAHNPVGISWGPRTPLIASLSSDNGHTWRSVATLEDEGAFSAPAGLTPSDTGVRPHGDVEFSYPAVIAQRSGVALTYTWKRRRIVYATISDFCLRTDSRPG